MKKNVFKYSCIFFLTSLAVSFITSCSSNTNEQKKISYEKIEKEFELLSSEAELNALLTRGNEGIVDWELSKEIAQMQLDSFIADGEYPESCELWKLPIGIYTSEGNIRFYEFRVINEGQVIAAIAVNAQESLGGPIAYIFSMNGYTDSLMELYNNGSLTENEIPRIVDNVYPNYVIATSQITKSGNISIDKLISPEDGSTVEEVESLVLTEDFLSENKDILTEEETAEKLEEISNYKDATKEFWKAAKENKGNLGNMVFRGGSKYQRKEIDSSMIQKAIDQSRKITLYKNKVDGHPLSYGACGATSSGFVLDYIDANISTLTDWRSINLYADRVATLRKFLSIADGSNITWPTNLSDAISNYSNYKVTLSTFWPKTSINSNIPGISLRALKFTSWEDLKGGFHYRNVVGYKEDGWWIFKWNYIKILDGNNCDDGWEAYNPLWHVSSFNVVKK